MAVIHRPAENVFDEQLITWILVQLKIEVVKNFKVVNFTMTCKIPKVKNK